jgi:hypothetical protein
MEDTAVIILGNITATNSKAIQFSEKKNQFTILPCVPIQTVTLRKLKFLSWFVGSLEIAMSRGLGTWNHCLLDLQEISVVSRV